MGKKNVSPPTSYLRVRCETGSGIFSSSVKCDTPTEPEAWSL